MNYAFNERVCTPTSPLMGAIIMTQFGIAHVAIICASTMALFYVLGIYPLIVAVLCLAFLGYWAFIRK